MYFILDYIKLGLILVGIIAILYVPVFCLLKKRIPAARQFCIVLFVGFVFVILFATVLIELFRANNGFQPVYHRWNLIPFDYLREGGMRTSIQRAQVISNILMFVPFGFLLPAVFAKLRSFGKTAFCALLFTVCIEVLQFFTGRAADIDDVILNFLGGTLGYVLFSQTFRFLQQKSWWQAALGNQLKAQEDNDKKATECDG